MFQDDSPGITSEYRLQKKTITVIILPRVNPLPIAALKENGFEMDQHGE